MCFPLRSLRLGGGAPGDKGGREGEGGMNQIPLLQYSGCMRVYS